jgi:parallel beta-helix repeat protein
VSSTGVSVNGDMNTLSGNRVTKSTFSGINFVGNANGTSDNNQILANVVSENGGSGIALRGDGNVASGNEVSSTQFNGIQLVLTNFVFVNNRIESNTVNNNSKQPNFPGIFIGGSTGSIVAGNRVSGTQSTGIHVGTGAVGALISSNQVLQGTADGIGLRTGSSGTHVIGNLAAQNGDDGIDTDVSSATLQGNTANANADWGIEAVAGVTDGGGNHASGNGHPGQCVNVVCT